MSFAARLQHYRSERGLSISELARRCHVTRHSVQKWLNGESHPKWKNLLLLADVLEVSVADLLPQLDSRCY